MRLLRATGLLFLGAVGGLAAAAAVLKRALPTRGDEESDEVALAAIFGGVDLLSRAQAFRGGSLLAWFGGINADLRQARLAPEARLTTTAFLGGIALRIPEGWRVESNVKAVLGGVDVKTVGADDPDAPTLHIDGLAVLGGVAVGAKPAPQTER